MPTADVAQLEAQVREHEPHLALDGGPDGLDFYRRLAAAPPGTLAAGGRLLLEVGDGQAENVATMLRDSGSYGHVEIRPDLSNTPRIVLGDTLPG